MTGNGQRNALITRYLLGQVSAEERAEVEDQYLRDEDLFEEMVAAENDLIDDYVRGQLSGPELRRFEASFLSTPERRERVELAKSFIGVGATKTSPALKPESEWHPSQMFRSGSTPGVRWAVAAALLVAVAGLAWMAVANRRLQYELDQLRAAEVGAQREVQTLHQQVADLQARAAAGQNWDGADLPAGSAILSFTLAPSLIRGHNQQQSTLRLAPGISQVRLLLKQDHDQSLASTAVLETAEGNRVWRGNATRDGGKVVIVQVPPGVFNRDDYVLRLFGTLGGESDEVGTYSFRVIK